MYDPQKTNIVRFYSPLFYTTPSHFPTVHTQWSISRKMNKGEQLSLWELQESNKNFATDHV